MGHLQKKNNTDRARALGSKMRGGKENHDSPEIPDMRVTSDIRGLPSRYMLSFSGMSLWVHGQFRFISDHLFNC